MFPVHVGSVIYQTCHDAVREQKTMTFEAGPPVTDRWMKGTVYPSAAGVTVYSQDIASRTQAEEKLAYHARLLENVHDAVIATDTQLRVTAWNRAATQMYGWSADEALGRHIWDLVPVELSDEQRADSLRRLGETGRFRTDAMTYAKDGTAVHAEGITIALRGDHDEHDGEITGYVNIRRDITERKQAEDKLRRSEAHLAEAQSIGHVGSWTWNPSTAECSWSLEHFRIFGLDPATFIPTEENTQRLIHPEDLPVVRRVVEDAVRQRRDFEVDYRMIRADGSIRYHRRIGHPAVKASDLEFVGMVLDVTDRTLVENELRRSEAYLAEGQRLSHTGSWAWNVSTGELFWSLEHFRICGVEPDSFTPTLETARQVIHPDDRASSSAAFDSSTRERRDVERQLRILRPDGTIRFVQSLAHPVFNDAGDLVEYVGTIMDVTEHREEEVARKDLLHRLIAAQEDERRRIAREMHDEFGQQLSTLTLTLATLRRDHAGQAGLDEQLAFAEGIARTLDADIDFLVRQLRPTALDDFGLIEALRNHVRRWSEHSTIQADWHVRGIDPARLTQEVEITLYRILQEALNNVAKHARATRVDILLEGYPEHVSLIVEDNGVGFETGNAFGADVEGLGLTGMRERAALVGGTVDIESRLGNGTTFAARIPTASPVQEGSAE